MGLGGFPTIITTITVASVEPFIYIYIYMARAYTAGQECCNPRCHGIKMGSEVCNMGSLENQTTGFGKSEIEFLQRLLDGEEWITGGNPESHDHSPRCTISD